MIKHISLSLWISKKLTEVSLRALAAADDPVHFNSTLHSICVPRVVGTAGHEQVKDYLIGELKAAGLTVQLDTFTKTAPIVGKVRFTNIIARLNPDADRFLALACHYDSKYFPAGEHFVGAIDSAVPCAMLLNAVRTLSAPLAEKQQGLRNGAGLMLIFFDGEEAFDTWTDTDSLYGSRHLARKMRDIDQIDALVLLDLIGAANPTFYNYFRPTVPLFQRMVEIERGLVAAGLMQGNRYMFHPRHSHASIADDHLPFEEQGKRATTLCVFLVR